MSFPRYERYKDSGISWVGHIPGAWQVCRLKTIFQLENRAPRDDDEIVTAFRDGQVTLRSKRREDGFTNALKEIGYQGVRAGDLVIHAMDAFAGAIGVSDSDGKSTPVYSICTARSTKVETKYFGLLLRYMALSGFINSLAKGIRERSTDFRWADAGGVYVPFPPPDEQRAIVAFLDRETAKIDALIEEQWRLIALLKEKRQAVISHAVTKGLIPSAPMKETGVEWLGRMPSHWDMAPLGYLARIETGGRDTENADADGQYPFFVRSQIVERINSYSFDGEGILTAGDGAGVGKVFHHFTGRFDFHQRVYLISHFQRVLGSYLFNYFKENFYKVALEGGAKSTVDSLRRKNFTSFPVPIPPHPEQSAIVKYVERLTARYDNLALEAEKAVQVLQERRSALISAAVTGKINVTTQVTKPVAAVKPYSTDFARQLLAAVILDRTCQYKTTGRVKLQKLLHLCEYHAQIPEIHGSYQRQAAGPFDPQAMDEIRNGLLQHRWFEEYKDGDGYRYREMEKAGEHKQNLPHWTDKQAKIEQILSLLGNASTRQCEIVSTLYAAWNDLLIDGKSPTDDEIIREASTAETWHASKEKIAADRWPITLKWMREKGLAPVGYGSHTTHQPSLFKGEVY